MPETIRAGRHALVAAGLILVAGVVLTQRLASTETTTVLVFCNAETQTTPADDPPLSVAGLERARELARLTADIKLSTIYTSTLQRTLQTAQPAATRAGVSLTPLPADPTGLLRSIRERHQGDTVVVVSSCAEVPAIIETLAGRLETLAPQTASEAASDRLIIVTLNRDRPVARLHLRYGKIIVP